MRKEELGGVLEHVRIRPSQGDMVARAEAPRLEGEGVVMTLHHVLQDWKAKKRGTRIRQAIN